MRRALCCLPRVSLTLRHASNSLDENGEDQPTRLDSADLSGCRYFRELLADPNVPRLYEDEENEGELLKTLTLPGWSLADLWLFLHLLVGSDAGKDITDFASLQRVRS